MLSQVGGYLRMRCYVPRLSRFRALQVTVMEVVLAMVVAMAVAAAAVLRYRKALDIVTRKAGAAVLQARLCLQMAVVDGKCGTFQNRHG